MERYEDIVREGLAWWYGGFRLGDGVRHRSTREISSSGFDYDETSCVNFIGIRVKAVADFFRALLTN
jgi:hypothetical protein